MAPRCSICGIAVSQEGAICARCSTHHPTVSEAPADADSAVAAAPVSLTLTPGTVLAGRYRVLAKLGGGAMGEVYKAEDQTLDQAVALKFLPAKIANDPLAMARVRNEVKIARRVSHPHVCRVHDLGDSERGPFLSMESIDGEDLGSVLRRVGRLPEEKAIELGRQICAGLAAAHAAGVLHRDLKPANVMLDLQGRAHITDFGIAVVHDDDPSKPLDVAGTPAYMAPEQLSGKRPSLQSDIYSFGVLLYELVTGKRPYGGATLGELRRQQERGQPTAPSMLVSGVGARLDAVIARCLAFDQHERPASAIAVLSELMGGDELGAALSAGQTPSPTAVANSVTTGALRPIAAWAAFAAIVLCTVVFVVFGKRLSLIEHASLNSHPEVLIARVQEILNQTGNNTPQRWVKDFGFEYDSDAIVAMTRRKNPDPHALPIRFWYRQGRKPSVSTGERNLISSDSPLLSPDELVVVLDASGRLIRYAWNPGPEPPAAVSGTPSDKIWAQLFAASGLDAANFREATPAVLPPIYGDTLRGWEAKRQEPKSSATRVVAGSVKSTPTYFEVFREWQHPKLSPAVRPWSVDALNDATLYLIVAVAAFVAWLNIRGGRGDRRGAMRLASFIFLLYIIFWLFGTHHLPVLARELTLLLRGVGWALLMASWIWVFYLALEPYVRRYSPASLVSWTRVIMGRFTDPMVARDILLGTLATWVTAAVTVLILVTVQPGAVLPIGRSLQPLLGARFIVAGVAGGLADAIFFGLMLLFLLLLGRSLLRRQSLAVIGMVCLLVLLLLAWITAVEGLPTVGGMVLVLLSGAVWVFVLMRVGLLGMVASIFPMTFGLQIPDVMTFSAWYSFVAWYSLTVYLAVPLFGLYFSVGKERLIHLPSEL